MLDSIVLSSTCTFPLGWMVGAEILLWDIYFKNNKRRHVLLLVKKESIQWNTPKLHRLKKKVLPGEVMFSGQHFTYWCPHSYDMASKYHRVLGIALSGITDDAMYLFVCVFMCGCVYNKVPARWGQNLSCHLCGYRLPLSLSSWIWGDVSLTLFLLPRKWGKISSLKFLSIQMDIKQYFERHLCPLCFSKKKGKKDTWWVYAVKWTRFTVAQSQAF